MMNLQTDWSVLRLIEMEKMLDNSFNSLIYENRDHYMERGFQSVSHRLFCFRDDHLNQDKFCYREYTEWCDNHIMHCYE